MVATKVTGVRLAPDVLEWLQSRAQEDERSVAYIIMKLARAEMGREAAAKKRKAKRT